MIVFFNTDNVDIAIVLDTFKRIDKRMALNHNKNDFNPSRQKSAIGLLALVLQSHSRI